MARLSKKKSLEDQIKDHDTVFVDEVLAASDDSLKDRLMRLAAYDSVLEKEVGGHRSQVRSSTGIRSG